MSGPHPDKKAGMLVAREASVSRTTAVAMMLDAQGGSEHEAAAVANSSRRSPGQVSNAVAPSTVNDVGAASKFMRDSVTSPGGMLDIVDSVVSSEFESSADLPTYAQQRQTQQIERSDPRALSTSLLKETDPSPGVVRTLQLQPGGAPDAHVEPRPALSDGGIKHDVDEHDASALATYKPPLLESAAEPDYSVGTGGFDEGDEVGFDGLPSGSRKDGSLDVGVSGRNQYIATGDPQEDMLGQLSGDEGPSAGFVDKLGRDSYLKATGATDAVFPLLGSSALGVFGAVFSVRRRGIRSGRSGSGTGTQVDISDASDPDRIGHDEMSMRVVKRGKSGQHKCGHSSNFGGHCLECDRLSNLL